MHGALRQTWAQTYARCRQLAHALQQAGIGKNDTVAVILPNTPPMIEAHFGVPMAGAVLNALNTRLDPEAVAFMLDHGEAKALIVDPEFAPLIAKALQLRQRTEPLLVIQVEDALVWRSCHAGGQCQLRRIRGPGRSGYSLGKMPGR